MFLYGDCYNIMEKVGKNSIDLILTDPPFTISKKSYFHKGTNTKYTDITHDFGECDHTDQDLRTMMELYRNILRPGGTLVMFYDIWKTDRLKYWAEKAGFKQPRIGIWSKTNPTPINKDRNYLSNAHEFYFSFIHAPKRGKRGRSHTFNSSYDNGIIELPSCDRWESIGHPNQKPINLMKELILKHSNKGDMVLDPFAGSGSTAIAADMTERNFICIENDEKYFTDSTNRYLKYKKDKKNDHK